MQGIDAYMLILLIVLGFSSSVINGVYAESEKSSFDFWASFGYWFEKASIVGVVATLLIYLHEQRSVRNREKQRHEEKFRRSRIALSVEICENQDHLRREEDRLFFSNLKSRQIVDYYNVIFATYTYQSIIHSGFLTEFDEDTQTTLAQLYSRIEFHNESLAYRRHLETEYSLFGSATTFGNWLGEKERHDLILTKIEEEIRELFPVVVSSLAQEATE